MFKVGVLKKKLKNFAYPVKKNAPLSLVSGYGSDRIVKKSESCGGVKIGECTVQRLIFADDLVLLASTQNGLQRALDRFSDACSVAGMKTSSTKT